MSDRGLVRRFSAAVAAAALALATAGCGAGGGRAVVLPPAFPADVPLPVDARVRTVRDLGPKGYTVVLETGEGVAKAAASFREKMLAAGWTAVSDAVLDGAVFTSYRQGERSVAVGAGVSGGLTQLAVSVVERPFNEWEGAQE